jgi:3-isopropylmalate dehydrogenase
MSQSILILPGDGIGPEVAAAAKACLQAVAKLEGLEFTFSEAAFGGAGIDACGEPLPEDTLKAAAGRGRDLPGGCGRTAMGPRAETP